MIFAMDAPPTTVDALAHWQRAPLGRALLGAERAALGILLEDVFGQHLVQVGAWGAPDAFLPLARLPSRSLIGAPGAGADCVAYPAELPLQSRSVSAVLLPHTLEFEAEPHETLREVERVLTGEGHVLIMGFEPVGPWALRHRLTRAGFPPGLKRLYAPRRLRDWLRLLGFDILATHHCLRTLPVESLQDGRVAAGLERLGVALGGHFGSVYLIKARKRVYTLTPIRLRRARARRLPGQVIESI